jgi:molybdopterin converting factor small subunit
MPEILFNAFSFLQKKLKKNDFDYANVTITVPPETSALDLIYSLKLERTDVECVFINGKADVFDYIIQDGDRVGLIPPGTPGPHRFLLGIRGNP